MKTPWSLIGWLLAGLLTLTVTLGLYYLGAALGWPPWLAPAILWLPLAAALGLGLAVRLLARPRAPALAVPDPANPLSGPWEALKSGLGDGCWELYLLVGDDDELKRSFFSRALDQVEYQSAPAGPDGLSLRAAEGRAWLNVPAALWDEPARAEVRTGGDWGHLLKLLPGFPGPLRGLVVLADPRKIQADPDRRGQILARRLGGLSPRSSPAPPWWLVLSPLENLASGRRLAEALNQNPAVAAGRRPFGLFLPDEVPAAAEAAASEARSFRPDRPPKGVKARFRSNPAEPLEPHGRYGDARPLRGLARGQSLLSRRLERQLELIDRWPGRPALAGEIFSFREEFRRLPLDRFGAAVGEGPGQPDGLFLAFRFPGAPLAADTPGQKAGERPDSTPAEPAAPQGGRDEAQFFQDFELLLRNLIPTRLAPGGVAGGRRSRRLVPLGLGLLLLALTAALALGYGQGRRALDLAAEAFPLLTQIERHPAAPPPVSALAAGADLVLALERRAGGLAGLYGAPQEAADLARERLAAQLRRRLPDDYARAAPFMAALARWADRRTPSLVFEYAGGQVNRPGFAAAGGRAGVAELAARWDFILGEGGAEAERLLSRYDRMVLAEWRRMAEDSRQALTPTPEKLQLIARQGLREPSGGLEFLKVAGGEALLWAGGKIPGWLAAARDLKTLDSLSGLGRAAEDGRELAALLRRIKDDGRVLTAGGVEKIIAAAQAWKKYRAEVDGLSELAGSPQGLVLLADEMFSGAPAPPERASVAALRRSGAEALAALEKIAPLPAQDERELFEDLFLSPPEWLGRAATAAAAAALEEEWRRKIVLPSKDLSEAEKVALLLGEEGAVAAFRDGPARPYLDAGAKGYRPKEFFGRKFPWSGEFLKFINASQEGWKKMAGAGGRLKLSARLRPVRAEGDRLLAHPLGAALEMLCGAERFTAESYNQPAVFQADWSPGECEPLKITIAFRDFKLSRSYEGSAGFTSFVKAAVGGEVRFTPDDFPDQRHLMKAVGAEAVALSLDLDRGREILKALTTPPPALKPPAAVIGE